jgi:hypothetical protein
MPRSRCRTDEVARRCARHLPTQGRATRSPGQNARNRSQAGRRVPQPQQPKSTEAAQQTPGCAYEAECLSRMSFQDRLNCAARPPPLTKRPADGVSATRFEGPKSARCGRSGVRRHQVRSFRVRATANGGAHRSIRRGHRCEACWAGSHECKGSDAATASGVCKTTLRDNSANAGWTLACVRWRPVCWFATALLRCTKSRSR